MVIFDEAHNIEQQCEDAASVAISSLDLAGCLDEITKVMQLMVNSQTTTASSTAPTDDELEESNIDTNGRQRFSSGILLLDNGELSSSVDRDTGSNL